MVVTGAIFLLPSWNFMTLSAKHDRTCSLRTARFLPRRKQTDVLYLALRCGCQHTIIYTAERKHCIPCIMGVRTPILFREETLHAICCGCGVRKPVQEAALFSCAPLIFWNSNGKNMGVGTPMLHQQVHWLKCLDKNHGCSYAYHAWGVWWRLTCSLLHIAAVILVIVVIIIIIMEICEVPSLQLKMLNTHNTSRWRILSTS